MTNIFVQVKVWYEDIEGAWNSKCKPCVFCTPKEEHERLHSERYNREDTALFITEDASINDVFLCKEIREMKT
jgi:hypothetical protein